MRFLRHHKQEGSQSTSKKQKLGVNLNLSYAQLKKQTQQKLKQQFPFFQTNTNRKNTPFPNNSFTSKQSFSSFNRSRSKSSQNNHKNHTNNMYNVVKKRPLTAWSSSFKQRKSELAKSQASSQSQFIPFDKSRIHTNNFEMTNRLNMKSYQYVVNGDDDDSSKLSQQYLLGSCQIKGMKMHHRPGSAQAFQSNTVGVDQAMKVGVFPRRYHPRNLYRHQVNNQQKLSPWENEKSQNIDESKFH